MKQKMHRGDMVISCTKVNLSSHRVLKWTHAEKYTIVVFTVIGGFPVNTISTDTDEFVPGV